MIEGFGMNYRIGAIVAFAYAGMILAIFGAASAYPFSSLSYFGVFVGLTALAVIAYFGLVTTESIDEHWAHSARPAFAVQAPSNVVIVLVDRRTVVFDQRQYFYGSGARQEKAQPGLIGDLCANDASIVGDPSPDMVMRLFSPVVVGRSERD